MNFHLTTIDIKLFNFISTNSKVTADDLALYLNKNNLTIKNSIKKLNSILNIYNLPEIKKINHLFILTMEDVKTINNFFKFYSLDKKNIPLYLSKEERLDILILLLIFEEKVNLISLSLNLDVTTLTLSSDLNYVKEILTKFNLSLSGVRWKGVYLIGTAYDKLCFAIKYLTKFFILNGYNSTFIKYHTDFYNPKLEDLHQKYILEEDFIVFQKVIKELSIKLGINFGILEFKSFIAVLTYLKNNKNNIFYDNGTETFTKEFQNYFKSFGETIKEIADNEKIAFLNKNNIWIFYSIFLRNTTKIFDFPRLLDNRILNFIEHLENQFSYTFPSNEKLLLYNLCNISLFKHEINLKLFFYNFNNIQKNLKFVKEIKIIYELYLGNIHDECLFKLVYFLNSIFGIKISLENNCEHNYYKKILFIDVDLNNWFTSLIKNELLKNYNIDKIDILVYHQLITSNINFNNYDVIFIFNTINSNLINSNIPTYYINWEGNIDVFSKYNLQKL